MSIFVCYFRILLHFLNMTTIRTVVAQIFTVLTVTRKADCSVIDSSSWSPFSSLLQSAVSKTESQIETFCCLYGASSSNIFKMPQSRNT